jgi:hypothetical protein
METLKEVKNYLRTNYEKGCDCPACGQFVKLYRRKLNSGMAVTLLRMHQYDRRGWINVKDFLRQNKFRNNHDWTLLRHWGLIVERDEGIIEGGKSLGQWRITYEGSQFVLNRSRVFKRILLYNNVLQSFDESETTNITEALGNKFNYQELMEL